MESPINSGPLVLLVEDDEQMRRFLVTALSLQGYRVVDTASGEDALRLATAQSPDLVLLDLGLPDQDGLVVTRRLREWSAVPIVVISARGRDQDKIDALDGGADDYVTKPFGTGELFARLRVARRHAGRAAGEAEAVITVGELRLDLARRQVFARGQEVHLTPIEYKLLSVLMRHAGKVLTHRQLLREVWGAAYVDQLQYVRVYMGQLRHKLEADPTRPRHLVTEPNVGYRLRGEPGAG